ncbi:MAG TPA: lactonase family protein [Herpetosiphonaceae bacterium]
MTNSTASEQPLVIVGSYAEADQPGIHLFRLDEATGTLSASGTYTGIVNPSFVVAHPQQPWLYAVSETSAEQDGASGQVWALRFDRDPLHLEPLNHQPSAGDHPCHLELDASGKWLLVSNYSSGTVAVLPIGEDGSLGEMTDLIQHTGGSGVNGERQAGPHAHSATFTPDQRFVIVADLGLDQLLVYAFDAEQGKLQPCGHAEAQPGAGPRHIAFHPNGRFVYVGNELNSTVSLYDYNAVSATLQQRQSIDTAPSGQENWIADIHLSPSGKHVFVSNRGHDSIAVFDVAEDGALSQAGTISCGGSWPRHFMPAPGGNLVLVANQHSGDVAVLPLDAESGVLGEATAHAAVPQASCVQFRIGL